MAFPFYKKSTKEFILVKTKGPICIKAMPHILFFGKNSHIVAVEADESGKCKPETPLPLTLLLKPSMNLSGCCVYTLEIDSER